MIIRLKQFFGNCTLAFSGVVSLSGVFTLPVESSPQGQEKVEDLFVQLQAGGLVASQALVGRTLHFEGHVVDTVVDKKKWLRPNPLRVSVSRQVPPGSTAKKELVCHVTFVGDDINKVCGCRSADFGVVVTGKITKVDPETYEVRVLAQSAYIDWSD